MVATAGDRLFDAFRKEEGRLRGFLRRHGAAELAPYLDVDDLVEEVFLRVWKKRASIAFASPEELYRVEVAIARKLLANERRRLQRRGTGSAEDLQAAERTREVIGPPRPSGDVAGGDTRREWLGALLGKLLGQGSFPALRGILIDGRRQSELASLWGVSRSAVKQRVNRESERLRAELLETLSPEEFEAAAELIGSGGFSKWLQPPRSSEKDARPNNSAQGKSARARARAAKIAPQRAKLLGRLSLHQFP